MKEAFIYSKHCNYIRVQWLHLTLTKMGLALHCHGELKLANGRNGRERDTRRKKESFPQVLAHLQALQNEFARTSHCQRSFPPRESRRNRFNFATSAQVPLNVVPAPLNVQKLRANQRSTLASGAQRPKNARRMALSLELLCSSLQFWLFFFFLLWLTTSLAWDKSFLSLNWSEKWGLMA